MANRYWVGGTATWGASAGTKWSTTSGGPGGAAHPTGSDDVFFDAASGSGVCSILGTQNCRSLTCTGFTGTLARTNPTAGNDVDILSVNSATATAVLLVAGMTVGGLVLSFTGSGAKTLTTAGKTLYAVIMGSGTLTLLDALTLTEALIVGGGTFDTGNFPIAAAQANFSNSPTVNLGSTVLTLNGAGSGIRGLFSSESSVTLNAGTSMIKLTNSGGGSKYFQGGGKTYNNVWIAIGGGRVEVYGSNTFNDLKIDAGCNIRFDQATVQTVSSFTATGSSGNRITLTSVYVETGEAFARWSLSKASGSVVCDWLDIADGIATGGATFEPGANSIDSGNNVGWFSGGGGGAFILNVMFALAVAFPAILGASLSGGPTACCRCAGRVSTLRMRQPTMIRKAA